MSNDITASSHVISGDLNIGLGEAKYLPWSCSRVDTANTCLYKFKQVYLDGVREESDALTLGGLSHEIIAKLLADGKPSIDKAELFLAQVYPAYTNLDKNRAAYKEVRTFFQYMVNFVNNWKNFLKSHGIKKDRIEHPYGLTSNFKRASYIPQEFRETYIRGIIDLWAYDKNAKALYIVDHKTNKSSQSSKRVKESVQLNLYAGMLSTIYNLKWDRAYIALNFLRRKKIVWAIITPPENELFMQKYLNTLHYLENKLYDCDGSMIWPARLSFRCSWCTFKNTCQTYQNKV